MGGEAESAKAEEERASEDLIETLYEEFNDRILGQLRKERDETRRYLLFLAWLNTRLEESGSGRLIITGGFAVEVFTGRIYRTMDVDIIAEGEAARIVEGLVGRFSEKIGRGYLPLVDVIALKSIDIVSTTYTASLDPVKLQVNSYYVYLEPPEELILRYLAGWKWWGSTEDRDKALWLYIVWRERLSHEYLTEKARKRGLLDKLDEIKSILEEHTTRSHTTK